MLAFPVKKLHWVIVAVVGFVIVGYFGWMYSIVRTIDQLKLVHIALFEANQYSAFMANFELTRRIRNGSENGVDSLNYVLMFAEVEAADSEAVLGYAEDLLAHTVDVNAHAASGMTALHNAIIMNRPSAVEFLLEHCADPSILTTSDLDTHQPRNSIELAFDAEKALVGKDYSSVIDLLNRRYVHCAS